MMLNYECGNDKTVYRVSQVDPQLSLLSLALPCPVCREQMTFTANQPIKEGWAVKTLSALELFQASNGLGFKSEQDAASIGRVSLCVGTKIKAIAMKEVGPRVIVDSITVEDNGEVRTMYFGTSTKGATIYKVVQGHGE